jgi:hypothetical protein
MNLLRAAGDLELPINADFDSIKEEKEGESKVLAEPANNSQKKNEDSDNDKEEANGFVVDAGMKTIMKYY